MGHTVKVQNLVLGKVKFLFVCEAGFFANNQLDAYVQLLAQAYVTIAILTLVCK